MRPKHFMIAVAVLLVGVVAVHRPLPKSDLFSAIPRGYTVGLDRLTEPEMFAAKLAHGRLNKRYEIGVFGNSRSVMVAGSDVGSAPGRFFNFAIPGASLRSSVALAEKLAVARKLPRTILISLDHFEIQFDGNPNIRGFGGWIERVNRDFGAARRDPAISVRAAIRAAWRHIYVGYKGVTRYFNAKQLATGMNWRLAGGGIRARWRGSPTTDSQGYRSDGSRAAGRVRSEEPPQRLQRSAPSVLVPYLREDIRRLGVLAAGGTRVIVYESPLHRASWTPLHKRPSAHAVAARRAFLAACRRHKLECHPFDGGNGIFDKPGWSEASHPPPHALGAYLRHLIGPARATGREAAGG